jgi:hypothetical protein
MPQRRETICDFVKSQLQVSVNTVQEEPDILHGDVHAVINVLRECFCRPPQRNRLPWNKGENIAMITHFENHERIVTGGTLNAYIDTFAQDMFERCLNPELVIDLICPYTGTVDN